MLFGIVVQIVKTARRVDGINLVSLIAQADQGGIDDFRPAEQVIQFETACDNILIKIQHGGEIGVAQRLERQPLGVVEVEPFGDAARS